MKKNCIVLAVALLALLVAGAFYVRLLAEPVGIAIANAMGYHHAIAQALAMLMPPLEPMGLAATVAADAARYSAAFRYVGLVPFVLFVATAGAVELRRRKGVNHV